MILDKVKVRLAMARACMDSPALAAAAGLPLNTVYNILRGRTTRPKTAGKIAAALGVDITEILESEED